MTDYALAGIGVAALIAYIVTGIIVVWGLAYTRAKLGKKVPSEGELGWLVVGWPIAFFAAIGTAISAQTRQFEKGERTELVK